MNEIDVSRVIEAGVSCAGFLLGTPSSAIESSIPSSLFRAWSRRDGKQLSASIKECESWLRVPLCEIGKGGGEIWHYGRGILQLSFGPSGFLFDISVFDGYKGLLWDSIRIGMPMSALEEICPLEYDSSEELYFPRETHIFPGVGFYADESNDVRFLHGISVFNFEYSG